MQPINTVFVFSVFSGTIQEVPESFKLNLGLGQLPLLQRPKINCKKCHGRFFTGREVNNLTYIPCKCVAKQINYKTLEEIEQKFK